MVDGTVPPLYLSSVSRTRFGKGFAMAADTHAPERSTSSFAPATVRPRRRARGVLLLSLLAVLLAAAPVAVAQEKVKGQGKEQTVTAYLMVQPREGLLAQDHITPGDAIDRYARTMAILVRTEPVLQRVLAGNADVQHTQWYRTDPKTALSRLQEALSQTAAVHNSYLIAVSMSGQDPNDVATIVNATARELTSFAAEMHQAPARATVAGLQKAREDMRAELKGVLGVLGSLTPREAPNPQQTLDTLGRRIQELTDRLAAAEAQQAEEEKTLVQQQLAEALRRSGELQETLARIEIEREREAQLVAKLREIENRLGELKLQSAWQPLILIAPATGSAADPG